MPDEPRPDRYDDAHEWRKATDAQITNLRGDVSDLKTGLGKVQAGQDYLASTVNSAVQAFQQAAKPKETQWGVLISLLALIVMIGGGFTTLTTMPITKNIDVITDRMHKMEDVNSGFAKFTGQSEAWREGARREIDQLFTHAQQAEADRTAVVEAAAYARGRADANEGRLDRLTIRVDKLVERTRQAQP
jgi:hypothetical protein